MHINLQLSNFGLIHSYILYAYIHTTSPMRATKYDFIYIIYCSIFLQTEIFSSIANPHTDLFVIKVQFLNIATFNIAMYCLKFIYWVIYLLLKMIKQHGAIANINKFDTKKTLVCIIASHI